MARQILSGFRKLKSDIKGAIVALEERKITQEAHKLVESAPIDQRIKMPSYKSLDEYIDVKALLELNSYISSRLETRRDDSEFWTGPYTEKTLDHRKPGSKIIFLTTNANSNADYFELDKPDVWSASPESAEFSKVMDFVATLPFKSTGRIIMMYDYNNKRVTAHRDHTKINICNEFIWLRTNTTKPFYMMNSKTGERKYVESYSAWFDTVNQFHGADAAAGLSLSIRVDGTFNDELRSKIPYSDKNMASTPSLWESIGDTPNRENF